MASDCSPPAPEASPQGPGDKLAVFWHEGTLAHDAGRGVFDSGRDPGFLDVLDQHPENADRVRNMVYILSAAGPSRPSSPGTPAAPPTPPSSSPSTPQVNPQIPSQSQTFL